MTTDPVIDDIRRVRHEISLAVGHDLHKLKDTFAQLEAQFARPPLDYGKERTTRDEPAAQFDEFLPDNQPLSAGKRNCRDS